MLHLSSSSSLFAFLLYTVVVLSQCNAGWVDPDTSEEFLSTSSHFEKDSREYELVSFALIYIFLHVNEESDHLICTYYCFLFNFLFCQVFSDEFEQDGRSFEDGADPRWTAIDKNDCKLLLICNVMPYSSGEKHIVSLVRR